MKMFFNVLVSVNKNLADTAYAHAVLAELQKHADQQTDLSHALPLDQIHAARSYAAAGEWSKVSDAVKQAIEHIENNHAA